MASNQQIRDVALKYGINPAIFRALVNQESGNRQSARSPAGAIGETQLMPATAKALGVNPYNERQNLEGGAKYLAQQLKTFNGNVSKALAAYNAGPGAVQKYGGVPPFAETQNYVKSILANAGTSRGTTGRRAPTNASPTGRSNVAGMVLPGTSPDIGQQRNLAVLGFLQQGGIRNTSALQSLQSTIAALRQQAQQQTTPDITINSGPSPTQPSPSTRSSGRGGSKVLELIYNDGGNGYGIKNGQVVNGQQVFGAVWAGHADHVHVAAGPKTVVKLGKLAQQMGLRVGENPHFGGVDPVHVPGSYHYKGEAIDVSGEPALMKRFARAVERYNRTRKL